jgi:hypothetical protein
MQKGPELLLGALFMINTPGSNPTGTQRNQAARAGTSCSVTSSGWIGCQI